METGEVGSRLRLSRSGGAISPGSDPRWPSSPSSYMGTDMMARTCKQGLRKNQGRADKIPGWGTAPVEGGLPRAAHPDPLHKAPLPWQPWPQEDKNIFGMYVFVLFFFWADESTLSLTGFSEGSVNYPEG